MLKKISLRKIAFGSLLFLFFLSLILGASIYFLVWTTVGSRFVLEKTSSLAADYVHIDLNIKDGNLGDGFVSAGPIKIDVPEVVSIKAQDLNVKWSLWHYLTSGTLTVDYIKAPRLQVTLADELFATDGENLDEIEEKNTLRSEEPFRINIPVKAVIRHLYANDFAFLSPIVDVLIGDLDLSASCFKDYAGVNSGRVRDVTVHLKYEDEETKSQSSQNDEILTPKELVDTVIEKFPTIDLPLDTKLADFLIIHGRYYMDGFDTGYLDGYADALWLGHILQVKKLSLANDGGKAFVSGNMDFSDYFGLDFKLHVKNAPLPESLAFLSSYFADFEANAYVKGSLADLHSNIKVQRPKALSLISSINVLDDKLPFRLDLKSPELSYPLYITKKDALDTKAVAMPFFENAQATTDESKENESVKYQEELFAKKKNIEIEKFKQNNPQQNYSQNKLIGFNKPSKPQGIVASNLHLTAQGEILGEHTLCAYGFLNGYGMHDLKIDLHANSVFDSDDPDFLKLQGFYFDSDLKVEALGCIYTGLDNLLAFGQDLQNDLDTYLSLNTDKLAEVSNKKAKVSLQDSAQTSVKDPFDCTLSIISKNASGFSSFLQGPFEFATKIKVARENDYTSANLDDLKFNATLGGLEAKSSLKSLSFDHHNLSVDKLLFKQGENLLQADGIAGNNSAIEAKLHFKNLASLVPNVHGALNGALKLSGDIFNTDLELFLRSKEIKYQDVMLQGLTVNARAEAQRQSGSMVLYADTLNFNKALRSSRKCTIDLSGSIQSHHLTLGCAGNNSGFVSLQGIFSQEQLSWHGEISDLSIATQFHQNISLKNKTELSFDFDKNSVHFGQVDLQSNIGTLSLGGGKYEQGSLQTSLKLDELDLNALAPILPDDVKMRGKISIDGVVGLESNKPYADLDFNWLSGRIFAAGVFLDFELFKGAVLMRNQDLALDLDAKLRRNLGALTTSLHIYDPQGAKKISGKLLLQDFALNRLGSVGDGFNELDGKAQAKFDIAGTLNAPLLYGNLELIGSAEPRYDIGRLDKFKVILSAHGNYGKIDSNIGVNGGVLELVGNLDFHDLKKSFGSIAIRANELPLFLMGYGSCFANLNADVSFGAENVIRGAVTIPKALISVQGLGESGTEPSKDEIIIGAQGGEDLLKKSRKGLKIKEDNLRVDLSIDLGSDVKVEAMGLKSGLVGGIKFIKTNNDKEIKALGKISSINGRADFYGHRFLVSYADSVFDGNIANPKISAEIIADPSGIEDEVEAGVRVRGRALDPDIVLFSKPAMSQNEILSYLLYGHGLDKNSNDPDSSSMQLLTALGLGTTTGLVNSLAGALGMNSLQFGSSGSGEQTQIGVQTYITNKIMMSYGYGVFTSVGEFKLRYELMRKLYAEFVSSLDQAVDLVYSFEFD